MRDIQEEHRLWLSTMFPDQSPGMPAMGVVEETAELLRAVLKHEQEEKYGAEPRYNDKVWQDEMQDAIGDCALYCCSLCNALGATFDVPAEPVSTEDVKTVLPRLMLAAVHMLQSVLGGYYNSAHMVLYLVELRRASAALDVPFNEAIRTTWNKVKRRHR